jgi:TPR repeat protein
MTIRLSLFLLMAAALFACSTMGTDNRLADYRNALLAQAGQGTPAAEYHLGMTYCCGFDGTRNDVTARIWLCRAALQGYEEAQYQLGRFYDMHAVTWRPRTGTQDIIQAYVWYSLAADQGHDMAALYKEALTHEMSPRAIQAAEKLKSHWKQKACSDVSSVAAK